MLTNYSEFRRIADEFIPGCELTIKTVDRCLRLELRHRASIGASLVVPAHPPPSVDTFTRWLRSNQETTRLHASAGVIEHHETCRSVVIHAATYGWTPTVFGQVVELMRAVGALDDAEARWLVETYEP